MQPVSQQVLEWMAQGEAKGKAEGGAWVLLRVLRHRFGALPSDLETAVRSAADFPKLESWVDVAMAAAALDDFRQAANL